MMLHNCKYIFLKSRISGFFIDFFRINWDFSGFSCTRFPPYSPPPSDPDNLRQQIWDSSEVVNSTVLAQGDQHILFIWPDIILQRSGCQFEVFHMRKAEKRLKQSYKFQKVQTILDKSSQIWTILDQFAFGRDFLKAKGNVH